MKLEQTMENQTLVENQMLVVDVLEDSLGGLELNDDRRLSMSITSASVDLFSAFSLRIFIDRSNDWSDDFISCSCSDYCTCSDDFISCSCSDYCTLTSSCVNLISFSSLAISVGIPTPCSKLGDSVCVRAIKYS